MLQDYTGGKTLCENVNNIQQDMQCMCNNIVAYMCKRGCHEKAININYYECVSVFLP